MHTPIWEATYSNGFTKQNPGCCRLWTKARLMYTAYYIFHYSTPVERRSSWKKLRHLDRSLPIRFNIMKNTFHSQVPGIYVKQLDHDDVIKWKHFPRCWPFVRGIHRSPVNSPHKGQWRGALMFSLICVWINDWVNNREAGDLRRYRSHYDVTQMIAQGFVLCGMEYIEWSCSSTSRFHRCILVVWHVSG